MNDYLEKEITIIIKVCPNCGHQLTPYINHNLDSYATLEYMCYYCSLLPNIKK